MPKRIANAVVRVHDKFVGKNVEDFAVFGKSNVAGSIDGAFHVVALDVARTIAKRDAAAAVDAADMAAGNADERGLNGNTGNGFGFFHGSANRADRGIEIDDKALRRPFRFRGAEREKFRLLVGYFRE